MVLLTAILLLGVKGTRRVLFLPQCSSCQNVSPDWNDPFIQSQQNHYRMCSWNNETAKGSVLHNRNITETAKYANNDFLGLTILSAHRPLMKCLHHQPDTFGGGISEEITRSLLEILMMSGFFFQDFENIFQRQRISTVSLWMLTAGCSAPLPPRLPLSNRLGDWPVSQPLCSAGWRVQLAFTGRLRRTTSCWIISDKQWTAFSVNLRSDCMRHLGLAVFVFDWRGDLRGSAVCGNKQNRYYVAPIMLWHRCDCSLANTWQEPLERLLGSALEGEFWCLPVSHVCLVGCAIIYTPWDFRKKPVCRQTRSPSFYENTLWESKRNTASS